MYFDSASGDSEMNSQNNGGQTKNSDDLKTNLIVNYLPPNMTQEEIYSLFSCIGDVVNCNLMKDKTTGQSLGYAFVNYRTTQDAEKAINTLNQLRLQNKTIKVSYARPCSEEIKNANIYISGLPMDFSQQDLDEVFGQFGRIITSRILHTNTTIRHLVTGGGDNFQPPPRGVGFVRFDKRAEADRAIKEMNGKTPRGCRDPITVKFANQPGSQNSPSNDQAPPYPLNMSPQGNRRPTAGPIHHPPGRFRYSPNSVNQSPSGSSNGNGWSIFVFNLAPETEDSALWQLFGPYGAVLNVKIIRDVQTNNCKGFAFVTMTNYDEASLAIQSLNGYTMDGRQLQVRFKSNKK